MEEAEASFAFVLTALVFHIFLANRVRLFRAEPARSDAAENALNT
jgi:hypothetical protein